MKALRAIGWPAAAIGLITLVVLGSYAFASHLLNAQAASAKAGLAECKTRGVEHTMIISGDKTNPQHTVGKLCDTLTIINNDDEIRLMAFGPHENHQPYDGITEKVLGPRQSFTIVFNKAGTYSFHDHLHDEVSGDFTVTM